MSTNLARLTDDRTELVAPLSQDSTPSVLDTGAPVVTATPAAVVTAAGAGAVAGYVAGQAAED